MARREALREAEIDHIIEAVPLKIADSVVWEREGAYWKAKPSVLGPGVDAQLVLDLAINLHLPGKYTFQLRQPGGVILRRLDVRGSHANKSSTGSTERWAARTHKHRFRDGHGEAFAYTPSDIPDTTAPARTPNPDEHRDVFVAFCAECGIDDAGTWSDPPTAFG